MLAFSSRFDLKTHERKRGDRNLMRGLVQQGRRSDSVRRYLVVLSGLWSRCMDRCGGMLLH